MKKKFCGVLIILLISAAAVQAQKIIDSLVGPESIIKVGNQLFVSNARGGFLSKLSADGKFIERKFSKGILHAPKGLAASGNTIFVTDTSRIVGFDLNTGEQVFDYTPPEARFLNDLCKIDDNTLCVTDSRTNGVYLVNIKNRSTQFLGSIPGANGITYNRKTKQLFGCGVGPGWNGQGKLFRKDLTKNDTLFSELPNSPSGFFDGIELMNDQEIIVDDWSNQGRIFIYDLRKHSSQSYTVHCGTADLFYDKQSGDIYLPDLPANRILVMNIRDLKNEQHK